jgi:hypothetical protein
LYTPTKNFFVSFGIFKGYQTWIFHGESLQATASAETSFSGVQEISNEYGNIRDILHDVFPMHNMSELKDYKKKGNIVKAKGLKRLCII